MIKRIDDDSSFQPSGGNESIVRKVLRQSGGSDHQHLMFDTNEEHKGISSSFSSDIKRIETQTFASNSTLVMRDRGISGVSQTSQGTTNIVRVVDDSESNSTYNSLLNNNRISDQRMKTQQVRKTAAELSEDLKLEEPESQSGSQFTSNNLD